MIKLCLMRRYVSSFNRNDTYIYFVDIEKPFDTLGFYGFDKYSEQCVRVPFTKLELVNALGLKAFYTKCEFQFNNDEELLSIRCGDSFLPMKKKHNGFYYSEKEINKLMNANFD